MSRKITRRDLRKMILNEIRLLSEAGFSASGYESDLKTLMSVINDGAIASGEFPSESALEHQAAKAAKLASMDFFAVDHNVAMGMKNFPKEQLELKLSMSNSSLGELLAKTVSKSLASGIFSTFGFNPFTANSPEYNIHAAIQSGSSVSDFIGTIRDVLAGKYDTKSFQGNAGGEFLMGAEAMEILVDNGFMQNELRPYM